MDLYALLKLVHIAAAITWVGGATLMTVLLLALMRRDDEDTLRFLSYTSLLGNRFFVPVALITIIVGLVLAWLGGWGLAAWTVLAAGTVAVTFTLGGAVLSPAADRCLALWRAGDTPAAMELGRRVIRLTKFDLAAQWAIIALMVLKPGWTDPLLLVPAGLVLLGVALALRPVAGPRPTARPA
jgi:uncharacterized membrane protein